MKKFFAFITLFTALFADIRSEESFVFGLDSGCNDGYAPNPLYFEILGGANFLQTQTSDGVLANFKTGYIVSGALGLKACYGWRGEFEYAFRKNSLKSLHFFGRTFPVSGHFQSSSYMANLLWDLPLDSWGCPTFCLRPFLGAGIGYDYQMISGGNDAMTYKQHKKGFAWQVMAGIGYSIFCQLDLSLEYKFHQGALKHLYNHDLGLGLTYSY